MRLTLRTNSVWGIRPLRHFRGRGQGFSLVELMIAIGIFAIGAIAVASIFPVAILLQKQTMLDTTARTFAENARATVLARGFDENELTSVTVPDTNPPTVAAVPAAVAEWELFDRSYQSGIGLPDRKLFWVPLFFDNNAAADQREWMVFLFVVKAKANAVYDKSSGTWANPADPSTKNLPNDPAVPGVASVNATINGNRFDFGNSGPRLVRTGDKVLDARGRDWIVSAADNAGVVVDGVIPGSGTIDIWYAHPGDSGTSSFVSLFTLKHNPADNNLIR